MIKKEFGMECDDKIVFIEKFMKCFEFKRASVSEDIVKVIDEEF